MRRHVLLRTNVAGLMPSFVRRLRDQRSGIALVEFAISLPVLMVMATTGLEVANYVITAKRISEIAILVSDNASRMGAQNAISNKPISEAEINDVFIGADLQAGTLKLGQYGRIVLSSLQRNASGGQTIKWQRCFGSPAFPPAYGIEGSGATGTSYPGMGPASNRITASPGEAVMVVEITYAYQTVTPIGRLPFGNITELAAFNVRDSRDLTTVYNTEGVTPSRCS